MGLVWPNRKSVAMSNGCKCGGYPSVGSFFPFTLDFALGNSDEYE